MFFYRGKHLFFKEKSFLVDQTTEKQVLFWRQLAYYVFVTNVRSWIATGTFCLSTWHNQI